MKGYYLSKIFQDVAGQYGEPGAYMHGIQKYPDTEYTGGEILTDNDPESPNYGKPVEKAILVMVGGINHARFANDDDIAPVPVSDIRMKVTSTKTSEKLKFKAKAKGFGFSDTEVEDIMTGADGWVDVLNHFGKKNNPSFDALNFDLTDL